jgi:hypothetical protein
MDPDEFERQLARQPMRRIPAEWREEILAVPADVTRRESSGLERLRSASGRLWLRHLLWPCPQAWAGLAAAWIVILALNSMGGEAQVANSKLAPPPPEVLVALREQQRLLAELIEPSADFEVPRAFVPRPRSERPAEFIAV